MAFTLIQETFPPCFEQNMMKWIHRKPFKCFDFLLSKFDRLRVRTREFARIAASFIHELWSLQFSPAKQWIMQPKPEGYGNNFTAKCGNCGGIIKVNGIHAFKKPFRHVFKMKTRPRCGCHGNEIPTCMYLKLRWNTTRFNQSLLRIFLACIVTWTKARHYFPEIRHYFSEKTDTAFSNQRKGRIS